MENENILGLINWRDGYSIPASTYLEKLTEVLKGEERFYQTKVHTPHRYFEGIVISKNPISEEEALAYFEEELLKPKVGSIIESLSLKTIEKLKATTILQLAQQLENDIVHSGLIRKDMPVIEYIEKYFCE